MSAPKFTPGPWGVRPDIGAPVGCLKIAHPNWPRGRTDALVAAVYGYKHEQEANAHLIAAAPELYAALEALLAFVEEATLAGVLNANEMQDNVECAEARAALAKARGEG